MTADANDGASRPGDPGPGSGGRVEIYDHQENRRWVVFGAASMMVLTGLLTLLPYVLPMEQLKLAYFDLTGDWMFGNPFLQLRFVGGPIVGFVTAYVSNGRWYDRLKVVTKAVVFGLVALYGLAIGYFLLRSVLVWDAYPVYQIVVFPLIVGLPLAIVSVFGGLLSGVFGYLLALRRAEK